MLKRPDYVVSDPQGRVLELYCKACGRQTAATEMRPKNAQPGAPLVPKFMRNNMFAEVKMEFPAQDEYHLPSYHVTNACRDCISGDMDLELLYEMYLADLLVNNEPDTHGGQLPSRIAAIELSAKGIE